MIRRTYWGDVLGMFSGFQHSLLAVIILSVLVVFVNRAHPQTVDEIFQNFKNGIRGI